MDHVDERREASTIDAQGIKPPDAYAVEARATEPGVCVIELRGELDMTAAPALRDRLDDPGARALVLDLAAATFVDSAVLRELLRARTELAARGVRLLLAAVSQPVARLLDLTGTTELFEAAPDVPSALRLLRA
jgi:anti-anti-sigma factor